MSAGSGTGGHEVMAEGTARVGEASQEDGLLLYWVSWMATVFTIGLFSSGILTCRKIHNSKSVGSVPHLPFVAASVNCALWMTYGLLKPDSPITYVNGIGLFLQLSYILIYHTYAEMKYKVQRDFVISLVLVLSIIGYYCIFASDHTTIVRQMGMFCNFFTILFFASPLASMAEVVRTKSTETMSFPLSVMSVCTAGSWVIYGVLISDAYVIFPNVMGVLLACVQVSLFVMYKQRPSGIITMEAPIV